MRVTIKDVAKKAQVSQATVSLVLNESPGISSVTREHVIQVMQELDYKPDALARSFSSRRAHAISLVMHPFREAFDDPYFTQLLLGVLEAVRDSGYQMILEVADHRFVEQKLWHNLISTRRVDGFLIATPYLDQGYLQELQDSKIPTLLLNGARPDLPDLDFVGYDDVRCGLDATYYLIGLGHRRIAHLAGPQNQASAVRRLNGYREALTRARIPEEADLVLSGDFKRETGEEAAQKLLALPAKQRPTALFCANDTMALAAIQALQTAGLEVPGDISVVGVDDTGAAASALPPLTTFRQNLFELGRFASKTFLRKLDLRANAMQPISEYLPMELIERATCAPPQISAEMLDSYPGGGV